MSVQMTGVSFSDSDAAPGLKCFNPDPRPEIFQKFLNPIPVQTPATSDTTKQLPMVLLKK